MNPEQLKRWIRMLEESEWVDADGEPACNPEDVQAVIDEMHAAWVEQVRKECA